jgi:hypothetical protein
MPIRALEAQGDRSRRSDATATRRSRVERDEKRRKDDPERDHDGLIFMAFLVASSRPLRGRWPSHVRCRAVEPHHRRTSSRLRAFHHALRALLRTSRGFAKPTQCNPIEPDRT